MQHIQEMNITELQYLQGRIIEQKDEDLIKYWLVNTIIDISVDASPTTSLAAAISAMDNPNKVIMEVCDKLKAKNLI
jgi:hypothetical protein